MLCITESIVRPLAGIGARIGLPIAGLAVGHYLDNDKLPVTGPALGMLNGFNLGNFAGDLIDKQPLGQAARNLALRSVVGNAVTGTMLAHKLPLSVTGGAISSEITQALADNLLKSSNSKKIKK